MSTKTLALNTHQARSLVLKNELDEHLDPEKAWTENLSRYGLLDPPDYLFRRTATRFQRAGRYVISTFNTAAFASFLVAFLALPAGQATWFTPLGWMGVVGFTALGGVLGRLGWKTYKHSDEVRMRLDDTAMAVWGRVNDLLEEAEALPEGQGLLVALREASVEMDAILINHTIAVGEVRRSGYTVSRDSSEWQRTSKAALHEVREEMFTLLGEMTAAVEAASDAHKAVEEYVNSGLGEIDVKDTSRLDAARAALTDEANKLLAGANGLKELTS